MKINQYCSVCKKHLDMEVIPTDDGGDDGVIWLRCPECQGFLPKFTGEGLKTETPPPAADPDPAPGSPAPPAPRPASDGASAPPPAPGSAPGRESRADTRPPLDADGPDDPETDAEKPETDADEAAAAEPVAEYAALLAAADTAAARPYRPSSSFEVGEVILHLAYDDVGIVVAKEDLPGGRKAVKVFFDGAGVVHLIEQAADGR